MNYLSLREDDGNMQLRPWLYNAKPVQITRQEKHLETGFPSPSLTAENHVIFVKGEGLHGHPDVLSELEKVRFDG